MRDKVSSERMTVLIASAFFMTPRGEFRIRKVGLNAVEEVPVAFATGHEAGEGAKLGVVRGA